MAAIDYESPLLTATVVFLTAVATIFQYPMGITGVPRLLGETISSSRPSPHSAGTRGRGDQESCSFPGYRVPSGCGLGEGIQREPGKGRSGLCESCASRSDPRRDDPLAARPQARFSGNRLGAAPEFRRAVKPSLTLKNRLDQILAKLGLKLLVDIAHFLLEWSLVDLVKLNPIPTQLCHFLS